MNITITPAWVMFFILGCVIGQGLLHAVPWVWRKVQAARAKRKQAQLDRQLERWDRWVYIRDMLD